MPTQAPSVRSSEDVVAPKPMCHLKANLSNHGQRVCTTNHDGHQSFQLGNLLANIITRSLPSASFRVLEEKYRTGEVQRCTWAKKYRTGAVQRCTLAKITLCVGWDKNVSQNTGGVCGLIMRRGRAEFLCLMMLERPRMRGEREAER